MSTRPAGRGMWRKGKATTKATTKARARAKAKAKAKTKAKPKAKAKAMVAFVCVGRPPCILGVDVGFLFCRKFHSFSYPARLLWAFVRSEPPTPTHLPTNMFSRSDLTNFVFGNYP